MKLWDYTITPRPHMKLWDYTITPRYAKILIKPPMLKRWKIAVQTPVGIEVIEGKQSTE